MPGWILNIYCFAAALIESFWKETRKLARRGSATRTR